MSIESSSATGTAQLCVACQLRYRTFKHRHRVFSRYGREIIQEVIQPIARFQMLQQHSNWNSCSSKHRCSTQNVWITFYQGFCFHHTAILFMSHCFISKLKSLLICCTDKHLFVSQILNSTNLNKLIRWTKSQLIRIFPSPVIRQESTDCRQTQSRRFRLAAVTNFHLLDCISTN